VNNLYMNILLMMLMCFMPCFYSLWLCDSCVGYILTL